MRQDKEKVFGLRREGKSYREIEFLTGASRSTLCEWFRNEEWSEHIKKSNNAISIKRSTEHLRKLNEARRIKLNKQYAEVEQGAKEEFDIYKENPLFMAGLMLYAGEGDRINKHNIKFANIDFSLHKIFIRFLFVFLKIDRNRLKLSILLYPDLDIEKCKIRWSKELNIPLSNFHKPQIIKGRHKTKKLHFGVGSTIFSSSFLKLKLLTWVDMAKKYLPSIE